MLYVLYEQSINRVLVWLVRYLGLHGTLSYFILLAGPAKDESLSDLNFQSFLIFCFFPRYLRISDCFCWTDWQNGWGFELCIQFLALVGQSIRTATGPIALILVPNGDLAKQIWFTFDKCRTFFGKGVGMRVSPQPNPPNWEGVENRRFCRKLEDRPIDF